MKYLAALLLTLALGSAALADGMVALDDTYYFTFSTTAADGTPTTLAGTPAIDVYEEGSDTQITAADTLDVDFDSVTGLHHVAIAATTANGFEEGKFYNCVIGGTTPTVDSVSVAGRTVARFRITTLITAAGVQQEVEDGITAKITDIVTAIDTWFKAVDYWVQRDAGDWRVRHHATDPTSGSEPTRYSDKGANDGETTTP